MGLIVIALFTFTQNNSYAQLGKLKNAIKNKVSKNEKSKDASSETSSNNKEKHVEDQGILHQVHQNNIGKIVWSNETIDMENPDPAKFKDHFNSSDWIHGRFYLSQSIENSIIDEAGESYSDYIYFFDVYVDGNKVDWEMDRGRNYGDALKRTTQKIFVYDDGEYSDKAGWTKLINGLKPGDHEIKADLRFQHNATTYNKVLATGSFTLTKEAGDVIKIGKSYSTIKAGMVNKAFESSMLTCMQDYAKRSGWKETFNKVKIQSKDWNIVRNKYTSVIIGRTLVAYCFATWPDKHCTVQRFVFMQDYNGNGYNNSFKYHGLISGSQEEVDCE